MYDTVIADEKSKSKTALKYSCDAPNVYVVPGYCIGAFPCHFMYIVLYPHKAQASFYLSVIKKLLEAAAIGALCGQ